MPPTTPFPHSASGAPTSARQHTRQDISAKVEAYEVSPDGFIQDGVPCTAIDLSRGGIGLLSRRPFMQARFIFVRFPLVGGRWRLLYGRVRNVVYAADGQYSIGVEFHPAPIDQATQRFIARLAAKHGQCDA